MLCTQLISMIVTNQPTQSGAQSNRPILKLFTLEPRSGPYLDDCVIVSLVKCVNRMQLQTLWNVTEIPFLVQSRSRISFDAERYKTFICTVQNPEESSNFYPWTVFSFLLAHSFLSLKAYSSKLQQWWLVPMATIKRRNSSSSNTLSFSFSYRERNWISCCICAYLHALG